MFSRNSISTAIVSVVLLSNFLFADGPMQVEGKPLKSTTGAVLRSLAIPGWGQLYNESYLKSAVFFAGETLLAISISHENDLLQRYKTGGDAANEKFFRNRRNELIWWLSGAVLLSMGDAYVDAQLFGLDITPNLSLNQDKTIGLSAALKF